MPLTHRRGPGRTLSVKKTSPVPEGRCAALQMRALDSLASDLRTLVHVASSQVWKLRDRGPGCLFSILIVRAFRQHPLTLWSHGGRQQPHLVLLCPDPGEEEQGPCKNVPQIALQRHAWLSGWLRRSSGFPTLKTGTRGAGNGCCMSQSTVIITVI